MYHGDCPGEGGNLAMGLHRLSSRSNVVVGLGGRGNTLPGTNISPTKATFEDDIPGIC